MVGPGRSVGGRRPERASGRPLRRPRDPPRPVDHHGARPGPVGERPELRGLRHQTGPGRGPGPEEADGCLDPQGHQGPDGFELAVFAAPPDVRYPTCLAASPTGEVFVGIDENGSLDAKADRGRVVRCVDADGDGKADKFNVFASDGQPPRGRLGRRDALRPPPAQPDRLSRRRRRRRARTAPTSWSRGSASTSSSAAPTTRPTGSAWGSTASSTSRWAITASSRPRGRTGRPARCSAAGSPGSGPTGPAWRSSREASGTSTTSPSTPGSNLFTRDNTNDGDGWDVRLSHVVPTGHYGYPSLFKRFGAEHVAPLADYGGGSPCGSLYLQEPGLPAAFGDTLYTCEWGRGAVFMHPLDPKGAGFEAKQETFVTIPRPTDIDVDGSGRIYVSSWRDGGFTYSRPDIGYVIRVVPKGAPAATFPDLKGATDSALVGFVAALGAVLRLAAQRELLRRGLSPAASRALEAIAAADGPLPGRVAAIFALEQGLKARSFGPLAGSGQAKPDGPRVRAQGPGRPQGGRRGGRPRDLHRPRDRPRPPGPPPGRHRPRPAGPPDDRAHPARPGRRRRPPGRARLGPGPGGDRGRRRLRARPEQIPPRPGGRRSPSA